MNLIIFNEKETKTMWTQKQKTRRAETQEIYSISCCDGAYLTYPISRN